MPSFFIRGLARYFAASKMAQSSNNTSSPVIDEVIEGTVAWNNNMRWLIPFVQATGYRIIIENPKSHEEIIITKDTTKLPILTSEWLRRYDKQELLKIMAQEEKYKEARRIAEERGFAKFGKSYKPTEKNIQDILNTL